MRARRSIIAWTAAWTAILVVLGCSDDASVPADTEGTTQTASSGTSGTVEPPAQTTAATGTAAVDSSGGSSTADDGSTTAADTGTSTVADDTSTGTELCEAPARLVPCDGLADEPSPFQAIGLDCPLGPDEAIPLESAGFHSDDPDAWAIATRFGTHDDPATGDPQWAPTHGEQLLVLSSGFVARPDAAGAVSMDVLDQDANDNPDDKPLPAPMSPVPGSSGTPFMGCDGVGDCSDSLWSQWLSGGSAANDLLWFQLRTEVPGGTHGFELDFAWFSEEYPESVGTNFNDMLVVWSASEAYVGNLCLVDEEPCTVSELWPVDHQGLDLELDGTGFAMTEVGDGGAMGWATIKGSAAPHELLELTVALFDMGDEELDTLVLLDGFGWDCEGCTPSPGNPCGGIR
jgi:hypothetical protein